MSDNFFKNRIFGAYDTNTKVIFNNFDGFSSIVSDNVLDRFFKIK